MVSTRRHSLSPNAPFTKDSKNPRAAVIGLTLPEQIENPVTGDRMTILHSTRDSNEEYLKVQFDFPPGAKGSPLHYHGTVSETFEVLSGSLEMELGEKGNRKVLRPGEIVQVPASMHHSFQNASNEWVTFTSEMRPGAGFEQFLRAWYGLAIDGKVNKEGVPTNPLHLALIVKSADTVFVGPPLIVQKLIVGALTRIARLLKVNQSLARYWSEDERREA